MPRSEALVRLHKTLLLRRSELRKRLGIDLEDLAQTKQSSATGDSADAAFETSGEEIASQLAELEAKELAQVERAVRRLKQGTYGKCESCNTKIPISRLNVLPYSTLCIKCQREMETDVNWMNGHGATDWARVSDQEPMDERDVNLSDIEIDMRK